MADAAIDYGDFNYSTGNKIILQYVADYVVAATRNRGNPIRYFTNVSNTVARQGDVARVQVTATPDSISISDGETRTLNNTVDTTVDITMSTLRQSCWGVTDMADLLSGGVENESLFAGRWTGLMNNIESDFMAQFVSGSTTNVVGTYGSAITEANVSLLAADIIAQKPPRERNSLHLFVSPTGFSQISQITNYNAGSVRGYLPGEPAPSMDEDYGENSRPWHNFMIHQCTSLTAPTVSGTVQTNNVAAHTGSVAIAMRPLTSGDFGGADGYIAVPFMDAEAGIAGSVVYAKNFLTFAKEVSVRCLYGFGIVKEPWTGLLKS